MVLNVMRDDASPRLAAKMGCEPTHLRMRRPFHCVRQARTATPAILRCKAVHFVVSSAISCENIAVERKVIEASR